MLFPTDKKELTMDMLIKDEALWFVSDSLKMTVELQDTEAWAQQLNLCQTRIQSDDGGKCLNHTVCFK